MNASARSLTDNAARHTAIMTHDRSLLVEAGAGSGKTAVMAGRIAMLLAQGIPPRSIAAVTFTELAASELVMRVRNFVSGLAAGQIPPEIQIALQSGLSEIQLDFLAKANNAIDEITCSTIHGFCQQLIMPYPVEANIDPGAAIMDPSQADLVFTEIVENWLRERLSGSEGGLIAEMVLENPARTVDLIHKIVGNLRGQRSIAAPMVSPLAPFILEFQDGAAAFVDFINRSPAREDETVIIAAHFEEMAERLRLVWVEGDAASLVRVLTSNPHPDLCTKAGTFLSFSKKTKWVTAAKRVGLAKADGERLYASVENHYRDCCQAWDRILDNAASRVLGDLIEEAMPVLQRFHDYKRSAALLDFDDLLHAGCDLLRGHEEVRQALANRYGHVLVDEFQDTDPLQTEIFWRLCGEPLPGTTTDNWMDFRIRPGALFLVGDPKQGIYRFRGADVNVYVRARDAFQAQDGDCVLSISTNFRSCAPILSYVNKCFEIPLTSPGQPGFTALDPFHGDRGGAPCIAALDVAVADENGRATAEQMRDGEAEAVAEMCARLIGSEQIMEHGKARVCKPGDIALLAPTGRDLWRYEEALERYGIPVATQAGKGLFRRQEIQDLIALTRVLADGRDTLALVSLLRGPLVGLTEEELLDIIWALPRSDDDANSLPRLDVRVDNEMVQHPHARDILGKLQALRRRVKSTTPHDILSQAVDVLRVRPILFQRHHGQAERVLANVDLYLSMTQAYAIRGLRAFAEAMTTAWSDEARAVEGRPDAQEEAVALYSMHAAKGLEWPIVVPINTMTMVMATESALTDRESNRFYCPVFGVFPVGYDEARAVEKAELDRERIRLWYVTATRARELLVIPRLDARASSSSWISLLDLSLSGLPSLDLTHHPVDIGALEAPYANTQSREIFAMEAALIADRHHQLAWLAPSRDEGSMEPTLDADASGIAITSGDVQLLNGTIPVAVQGGRERGLVIHKLFEEVLTGETGDEPNILTKRAAVLIRELGQSVANDPAMGLSDIEIARCISRTLALPEIVALRPTLIPEFPVYASDLLDNVEQVTAGITDATSIGADGTPQIVIDWKSDVNPAPETIEHYRAQIRSYLQTMGIAKGLIVFVTSGTILPVSLISQSK